MPLPPRAGQCQETDLRTAQEIDDLADVVFPPQEGSGLQGQVIRMSAERHERGEIHGQIGVEELEDVLRFEQIAQPVRSEIPERGIRGEAVADQLLDRLREQNLATMADGQQASQTIEWSGEVVATIVRNRLPSVERHTDAWWIGCAPLLAEQSLLGAECRGHGVRGGGEGGLHSITDRFETDSVVGDDPLLEQGQVAIDRRCHGGTIAFPQLGRALDVGKEEGDGTSWKRAHSALTRMSRAIESYLLEDHAVHLEKCFGAFTGWLARVGCDLLKLHP